MEPDSDLEKLSENPLADLSGEELLRRWKRGNEQAAEIIVDRYAIRLVALVASRLNRRYRAIVDPEDVVQSAMGSFFAAARQSRLQVSQSVSLWRLLATFAKRKMLRSIERQSAAKRGGDLQRIALEAVIHTWAKAPVVDDATTFDELLASMHDELPSESCGLLDRLIGGQTQKQIATDLRLTERTVRRRVVRLREMLAPGDSDQDRIQNSQFVSTTLPQIDYREFVLGKLIGSGAFGKVYRASMQVGEAPVAVKFLRKTFWKNNDAKQSFLREIDQAAQIDHPSIIRYLGWGQSPHGGPYVIAQWIDGVTLTEQRSVSPEVFIRYLEQICDALQAVHDGGIIHGDLTPHNILVNELEHLWITDFGFSRSLINHDDVTDHHASPLGGTLGFAAPEQVSASFGRIGRKTDIYAIGGLAYWYLTGRPPHDEGSIEATLASTVSSADVDSASLPTSSTATQAIKRVAARTLQKSIYRRPENIGELRKLL